MAEANAPPSGGAKPDAAARRRWLLRIGVAAALIALLIGALALYDASVRPSRAPTAAQDSAPQRMATGIAAQSGAKEEPAGSMAGAPPAAARAAEESPASEPSAAPERTTGPSVAATAPPAGRTGAQDRLTLAPAPTAGKPAVASPSGSYLVQAGVFNDPNNAQELQARLVQAGIPYQVETRVQAGPFASRREALAAREKLRGLGVDSPLLIPPRR